MLDWITLSAGSIVFGWVLAMALVAVWDILTGGKRVGKKKTHRRGR